MNKYKFFKKKAFESMDTFEKRLNEIVNQGWKVHSFTHIANFPMVLLVREDHINY